MRILLASSICPEAIERLRAEHDVVCAFNAPPETLAALIRDREVLVFRSGVRITAEVMEAAPHLQLLVRAGSGLDNLDCEYAARRGLRLARIAEPGAQAVAEMSFAFMLAMSRRLLEADRLTRQGRWAKHELTGHSLIGKVLGIVGVGNIGTRVGCLGVAWGMQVIGCDEHQTPACAARLRDLDIRLTNFDEVLSTADYLSLHVPLKDSTRHLIGAAALARMKPGAFLVNLSRGGVVDEAALYRELCDGGRLAGAAVDVFASEGEGRVSPLAELPNVILTPHIGAMTFEAQRDIGRRVIEIIDDHMLSQPADPLPAARRRPAVAC